MGFVEKQRGGEKRLDAGITGIRGNHPSTNRCPGANNRRSHEHKRACPTRRKNPRHFLKKKIRQCGGSQVGQIRNDAGQGEEKTLIIIHQLPSRVARVRRGRETKTTKNCRPSQVRLPKGRNSGYFSSQTPRQKTPRNPPIVGNWIEKEPTKKSIF